VPLNARNVGATARAFAERVRHAPSLRKGSLRVKGAHLRPALVAEWLTRRVTHFLEQPVGRYERHHPNDLELLKQTIEPGDVLLVEGHQRVSVLIKYLTHSSWSHTALYVGDELLRRGGALRELALEHFGDQAEHLVIEALMEGVVASPLSKYAAHNVRICRPHRLRSEHLGSVMQGAIGAIGWRYDLRNVVDLALHLVGLSLLPLRYRQQALRSGRAGEVICTSLLGRLFHDVGFPVLPSISLPDGEAQRPKRSLLRVLGRRHEPYSGVYRRRPPRLLMPRDFDHSPFFEIVKFNVVAEGRFDYQRIEWAKDEDVA
jgi:hypothetical protein